MQQRHQQRITLLNRLLAGTIQHKGAILTGGPPHHGQAIPSTLAKWLHLPRERVVRRCPGHRRWAAARRDETASRTGGWASAAAATAPPPPPRHGQQPRKAGSRSTTAAATVDVTNVSVTKCGHDSQRPHNPATGQGCLGAAWDKQQRLLLGRLRLGGRQHMNSNRGSGENGRTMTRAASASVLFR
jgi:hypothetical protein